MSKYDYVLPDHAVEHGIPVRLSTLVVDQRAQRGLNDRRVRDLAAHFIPEAAGELTVSRRADGTMALIDGQHRRGAATLAGETHQLAEIHHGLTVRDEAQLFLLKNREASKPLKVDEYRIGLTAEHPLYLEIEAEVSARELQVGHTSANSIGAIGALESIVIEADRAGLTGRAVLGRVLDIAGAAWGRTAETWDGMLLAGLGMFVIRHGDAVDDDEAFARKLAKAGPAYQWRGRVIATASADSTAQTGTSNRRTAAYRLILATWNKGRRSHHKIAA